MSERQMHTSIKDIEISHKARYFFASSLIKKGDVVLDACCGVGYGSMLMSEITNAEHINAFDISKEAIDIAKFHFHPENVDFYNDSFESIEVDKKYDLITCFEAIEHVEDPEGLVNKLCSLLKYKGVLVISTPNEHRMHWTKEKFPEHLRHFTVDQMIYILESNGIRNIIPYSQEKWSPCIQIGDRGKFVIFVGTKI